MTDLSADCVAAAALSIVEQRGLSSFTMRAVAEALGVTPMALYHHVKDKAALAALMVDAVNKQHPLPEPTGEWLDDLCHIAHWMRAIAFSHPGLPLLRRTYGVWASSVLRLMERWTDLWQQSGLDPDTAALAAITSNLAVAGLLIEETTLQHTEPPADELLDGLPNVRLLFEVDRDPEARFELAVRSLFEGLYNRFAKEQQAAPSSVG